MTGNKRGRKPFEKGEKKVRMQYYPKQKHIDLLGDEAKVIAANAVSDEYEQRILAGDLKTRDLK